MANFGLVAQLAPIGDLGYQVSFDGREGMVYNSKIMRISMLNTPKKFDDFDKDIRLKEFQIGYRFNPGKLGLKKLSINKRLYGVKGYSLYPGLSTGLSFVSEKNANNTIDRGDYGIHLMPSYNLNVPFCGIEFTLNSTLYFKNATSLGRFKFAPSIAFKFDGLFEILDESIDLGSSTKFHTLSTVVDKVEYTQDEKRVHYHIEENLYNKDYYYWAIGNFSGFTPRYTYTKQLPYVGRTQFVGLGYNIRFNQTAFDLIVETGKQGYASNLKRESFAHDPKPKDNGINKDSSIFAAEGQQSRIFFRYGIDIYQMVMRALSATPNNSNEQVLSKSTKTSSNRNGAFRVMGGLGAGYAIVQKPHFIYSGAQEKLNKRYLEKPDLLHNSFNDPTKSKSGFIGHGFISVEYGLVCFEWSTTLLFNGPLSTSGTLRNFSISYIFPMYRIKKAYKDIKAQKEYMEENAE